ncbi:MAG: HD domain-containing phosphohydrolase [Cyanobacteria bacterium J06621_8]
MREVQEVDKYPLDTEIGSSLNHNSDATTAKILIVDENPLSRITACDLLALDGYETIELDNSSQLLADIKTQQPDLILLDAMLKQVDSFSLCRQLKENSPTADIPIIFTTLADSREDRIKAIEAGGSDLLIKPLNRSELSIRVKSLINHKRNDVSRQDVLSQTEQVLFSIAKALDSRSAAKGGSVRLTSYAQSFGQYLDLSPESIEDLVFAARLHDIGTIAIPDAVMLKASKLTDAEREIIRQHVLVGEEICQPLLNRSGVLPIIRHHHEKWDGTGYPDGLAGEQIPYLAQIFQVIDIYDALTSDRPHKKAYSSREALQIMQEEADKGWRNPQLIGQFASYLRSQTQ